MGKERFPGPLQAMKETGLQCTPGTSNSHKWSTMNTIKYHFERAWSKVGGNNKPASSSSLAKYKDEWVSFHKNAIIQLSNTYQFPPEILGGIAWTEVGGDPDFVDKAVIRIRAFDHSGDPYLERLTITKRPEMTSIGDVSIQVRNIAKILGYPSQPSWSQIDAIEALLECETTNLAIVAKYISEILEHYYPGYKAKTIDEKAIMIVGYAYNMGFPHKLIGVDKDLNEIPKKKISNYGHDLVKKLASIRKLLGMSSQ